jgi:hypothetical protein
MKGIENAQVEVEVIDRFRRPYGFLSNMAKCEVCYNGETFHSVEQAYQFAKCVTDADRDKIRRYGVRPDLAKKISHRVTVREDWREVKLGVMEDLLRQKFSVQKLREKLLSTGSAVLIEGNEHGDYFWGQVHGVGQNMLGRLLMKIRQEKVQAA